MEMNLGLVKYPLEAAFALYMVSFAIFIIPCEAYINH